MRPDISQISDVINENKTMLIEREYKIQPHRKLITVSEMLRDEVVRLNRIVTQLSRGE